MGSITHENHVGLGVRLIARKGHGVLDYITNERRVDDELGIRKSFTYLRWLLVTIDQFMNQFT